MSSIAPRSQVRRKLPRGTWSICSCGDHAFAPVGRGLNALVSPEDAAVFQYKWSVAQNREGYRAVTRSVSVGGGEYYTAVLCRLILEAKKGDIVDHKNGDTLDNRRHNIRICTRSENATNSNAVRGAVPYRGVQRRGERFVAIITKNGVRTLLGYFGTPEEARDAYERAAPVFHGDYTRVVG